MTESLPFVPGPHRDDSYELHRGTDARLLGGFLRPHISGAEIYRRAVGFFSSSVFAVATDEFGEFFRRGGRIEVVCSPVFSAQDVGALRLGLYEDARRRRDLDDVLRPNKNQRGTATLAWAIGAGQLDLRVAIVQSADRQAIYHEKIGLLSFANGRRIAFEGSANESSPAYVTNFERIVVYRGTTGIDDDVRVQAIEQDFERLWRNETPGITVVSLHEAFKRRLLQVRPEPNHTFSFKPTGISLLDMTVPAEILKLPPRLKLRPYQDEAIQAWLANGGCGIYAMATGAGKTITALATLEQLLQRVGPPLVIIIVAPSLNLVDQWIEEAREFGLDPINCSGSSRDWTSIVDMAMYLNQSSERPVLSLVTTNATFAGEPFQRVLSKLRVRTVLIADEVHNLGARHLRRRLPDRIQLRLGLSATPERWMDEEGTAAVTAYFGRVVYRYDLQDALRGDPPALCPYVYRPVLVELEEDEREEYLQITSLLARYMNDPRDRMQQNETGKIRR